MEKNQNIQKMKMSCGAHLIEYIMDDLQNFHSANENDIIENIKEIDHVGITHRKFEKLLNKYAKIAGYQCSKKGNTSLDEVKESLKNGLQVPCLIAENSAKNPHATLGTKNEYNLHYVSILGLDEETVTIKNPFYEETETLSIQEFKDKWGLSNIPLSTKAKIFQKLGNIEPYTSFMLDEIELKLPIVLDLITNQTDKGWEFKKSLYLQNDWKKTVIEKSIKDGTLGVGATDVITREALYQDLEESPKENIAITMGTGGQFGRRQFRELIAAIDRIKKTGKKLVSLKGGSAGSLGVILRASGYSSTEYINILSDVPEKLTNSFGSVQKNFAYIAGAKMLPFTTEFSFIQNGETLNYNKDGLVKFLMLHFEDIFDLTQIYRKGGSLKTSGGFLTKEHIQNILQELIGKFGEEFEQYTGIDAINDIEIDARKTTFGDLSSKTGVDIGTFVAGREEGSRKYKTVSLDEKNDNIYTLDAVMGSSNVSKKDPLKLQIGGKKFDIVDPYYTTKTTVEKEIHDYTIGDEKNDIYHLGFISLNNFRFNPSDRKMKLFGNLLGSKGIGSERFYADGVLAPNFKDTNSLQSGYIQDIDNMSQEFMGKDYYNDLE